MSISISACINVLPIPKRLKPTSSKAFIIINLLLLSTHFISTAKPFVWLDDLTPLTFSDVIRKLSTEFNTDLLDLREIFMSYVSENNLNNEPAGLLTYDGVHLNDLGNKLIADEMIKFIN